MLLNTWITPLSGNTLRVPLALRLTLGTANASRRSRPPFTTALAVERHRPRWRRRSSTSRRPRRCGLLSGRSIKHGELRIITPHTARDGRQGTRAADLLERHVGVVRILEPVEAPVAPLLEERGHLVALAARADAAVAFAGDTAELRRAAVEETDAAAGHLDVEVVAAQIATGVCRLDDHGLAGYGARGECEPGTESQYSGSEEHRGRRITYA
jgi:hypothetical protein